MFGSASVSHPRVLWAQDKKHVYVTIELVEAKDEVIAIEPTKLSFSAMGQENGTTYVADLELYQEIDTEKSTKSKTDRHFYFNLAKKDEQASFWPRLLKSPIKAPYIHTDFAKWRDEDEDSEALGGRPGDFDPSMFNFGGGGAMEDDDDDEDSYGFDKNKTPAADSSSDEGEKEEAE